MSNCLDFKTIKLQPHQKIPSVFILNPLNRGLLLFYAIGTGKTIASLSMIRCLLTKYPKKRAIILTPASLVTNYENELDRVKEDIVDISHKIKVHSYVKFINNIVYPATNDTILVIDESQNFLGSSSIRYKKLLDYSKTAYKVILLSATPIRNSIDEISNELSLLNGHKVSKTLLERIYNIPDEKQRLQLFSKILSCKIAFYEKPKERGEQSKFPERTNHPIDLVMSKDYYQVYYKIQKDIINKQDIHNTFSSTENLKAFYNGIRKASNIVTHDFGSPKIKWTIHKIQKDLENDKKVLVYSNFLSAGVELLEHELQKLNINYSLVTGKLTQKQKEHNIRKYNDNTNKVIIISSSGAEGLNLKGTRSVIILERSWNNSKLEQVIGRAIRLNSHSHLPLIKRKVDVYNLMLVKPLVKNKGDYLGSADQILEEISSKKENKIQDFYKILQKLSIEKNSSCF
jgi:SNF2 family DNA or RNA helicase